MITVISDDHLDNLAEDFIHNHPFSGQRSFEFFLHSYSLKIQCHQIREALYQCDVLEAFKNDKDHFIAATLLFICQIACGILTQIIN